MFVTYWRFIAVEKNPAFATSLGGSDLLETVCVSCTGLARTRVGTVAASKGK